MGVPSTDNAMESLITRWAWVCSYLLCDPELAVPRAHSPKITADCLAMEASSITEVLRDLLKRS